MSTTGSQRSRLQKLRFDQDDALLALSSEARRHIGGLWRRRAENELCTSSVFRQLDAELQAFGAPPQVLALSGRAITDEAHHSELCLLVASHYLGEAAPFAALPEPVAPSFPVCSARVHRALFAALHCSVNETLAVTYLSACLAEARSDVARQALREILGDEVRHARIGWAVLASPGLTTADRASIAGFMPALLDVCVGTWLADMEEHSDALPAGHGCITHARIAESVAEAIEGLILPGLEHVGIDSAPARRWVSQTQPATRP